MSLIEWIKFNSVSLMKKVFQRGDIGGFLLTSMIYAAAAVCIIEKKFLNVSLWFFTASVFSFFGVIHAFKLTEHSIDPIIGWNAAPNFALLYLLISGTLLALHCYPHSESSKTSD